MNVQKITPNFHPYIKSQCILKQILSHLNEKNLLKLIKHNKALQKVLKL